MKLKKLLTPVCCAIVAAMGLTLTGCDLNVRDVLDEISSVVNEEIGSDTDYESSSDKDSGTMFVAKGNLAHFSSSSMGISQVSLWLSLGWKMLIRTVMMSYRHENISKAPSA